MADRHFVVVAYDIGNDRRRTKLHDALLDYGTPVQYSVFECILTTKELARMKKAVQRVIKPTIDEVRYYYLCRACQAKAEATPGSEVVEEPEVIIV